MTDPHANQPAVEPPLAWAIWRMDDNGNRFLVLDNLPTRADAERLVAEFAARGHKQVYWSEPQRRAAVD
jgi:hypothetical protein